MTSRAHQQDARREGTRKRVICFERGAEGRNDLEDCRNVPSDLAQGWRSSSLRRPSPTPSLAQSPTHFLGCTWLITPYLDRSARRAFRCGCPSRCSLTGTSVRVVPDLHGPLTSPPGPQEYTTEAGQGLPCTVAQVVHHTRPPHASCYMANISIVLHFFVVSC